MSKIICDVCGTSYQDSSEHCPICGCARPVDAVPKIPSEDTKLVRRENYTYVKGGRFSKANVKKRRDAIRSKNNEKSINSEMPTDPKISKGDKGLVIAVCALLLAIIVVAVYIAINFFAGPEIDNHDQTNIQPTTTQSAETTPTTTVTVNSCTGITISQSEITLTYVGEEYTLSAIPTPSDTTDVLIFASSDDAVATVSDSGTVVAIADGEATITVTCGEASVQCHVVCSISPDPTDVVTEPTVDTGAYTAPYKINKTDVSIAVGETFELKLLDANGEIISVNWSAAIDDICSIDGNSITGLIKGKVEISVIYEGETFTCIVRVR